MARGVGLRLTGAFPMMRLSALKSLLGWEENCGVRGLGLEVLQNQRF